ncbi:MAG: hypothetical protein HY097_05470 [Nitrospinae bacterium]|nr:hypothetical protein [Nitrospinota bacterium]
MRKTVISLIFFILLPFSVYPFQVTKHPSPVLSPLPSPLWDTHEVEPSSVIKDGDTYKMWYTAYDGKTYRIGYMSSKNGDDWERLENPVLDVSSKEFWDNFGVAYPFVMKEGAVYNMWYTGSNGKRMAIGYATSDDGIKWVKHPSVVLQPESREAWDGYGASYPFVVKEGEIYKMWYAGFDGEIHAIGYAFSKDGMKWERFKKNPVFTPKSGWDGMEVIHPYILKTKTGYRMWYSGKGDRAIFGDPFRIGHAVSSDGIHWRKSKTSVLDPAKGGSWEMMGVYRPVILQKTEDKRQKTEYVMYYAGFNGRRVRIGLAFSKDGNIWNRYEKNPAIDVKEGKSWASASVFRGTIVKEGDLYRIWYAGSNDTKTRIGHAVSRDGINFVKFPEKPVLEGGNGWERIDAAYPFVVKEDDTYKMWYTGSDGSSLRIGYATSRDGITWEKYSGNPVVDLGKAGSWDSMQIAYPSVIRDSEGYRLYYAGFDGKKMRVGFAFSRDGVHWKKSDKNPVMESEIGISYPWVIKVHSERSESNGYSFKMWYSKLGGGSTGSPSGYNIFMAESSDGIRWKGSDNPLLPPFNKGGKGGFEGESKGPFVLKEGGSYWMGFESFDGSANRIYLAAPMNSVNWTVFDKALLDVSAGDDWESYGVSSGTVIKDGGVYKLWYSGHDKYKYRIGYAVSEDGIDWKRSSENPVMDTGTAGSWDSDCAAYPFIIKDGDIYKMWYNGFGRDMPPSIGYATSKDGVHWERYPEPALTPGSAGIWDSYFVGYPTVIKEGDKYLMWYAAIDNPYRPWRIGYAESKDGISWVRHDEPVLNTGQYGEWDESGISYPRVIKNGSKYILWYSGINRGALRIGIALSEDGIHWEKSAENPVIDIGEEGAWDEVCVFSPMVLFENNRYKVWYTGFNNERIYNIGYAEIEGLGETMMPAAIIKSKPR